ncbi:MAG: Ni/Fe-hydrogenase, b-type cytochrome subunit [Nitrospinota bacterium]
MESATRIKVQEGVYTDNNTYFLCQTRSSFACILHWILAISVLMLGITGFMIANPPSNFNYTEAYQTYIMGKTRLIHFSFAGLALASVIIRFYLAFTSLCSKDIMQFLPTPSNVIGSMKLVQKYIVLKEPEDHYRFVNPLGGIGVFSIATALLIMTVTGMLLYLPGADHTIWGNFWNHSETFLGSQQQVRLIHHMTMYLLGLFVVIHVYMQFWKNTNYLDSDMSSIIGGYKLFRKEELGNFNDQYGERVNEAAPSEELINECSKDMPEGPGNH